MEPWGTPYTVYFCFWCKFTYWHKKAVAIFFSLLLFHRFCICKVHSYSFPVCLPAFPPELSWSIWLILSSILSLPRLLVFLNNYTMFYSISLFRCWIKQWSVSHLKVLHDAVCSFRLSKTALRTLQNSYDFIKYMDFFFLIGFCYFCFSILVLKWVIVNQLKNINHQLSTYCKHWRSIKKHKKGENVSVQ